MSDNSTIKLEMPSEIIKLEYCSDSSQSEKEHEETNFLDVCKETGNFPLTPFNMDEELEEGYFDREGMYHWKKKDKSGDNWLDNLCNNNVQGIQHNIIVNKTPLIEKYETKDQQYYRNIYKKILSYLLPNETIAHALRRFGGVKKLTTIERLKLKKLGVFVDSDCAQQFTDLTALVNIVVQKGDFDIYQKTSHDIFHNSILYHNNITEVNSANYLSGAEKLPKIDIFAGN